MSHYNDESNKPLYPFGYGLSYTTFSYTDFELQEQPSGQVRVTVKLTNTGSRAGEEVVQLYLHDKVASQVRPVKELKGFQKVSLAPGESKMLVFELGSNEFGFYDPLGNFVVEPGEFEIMVGGNSENLLRRSWSYK